ncbi:hypothetical protein OWR29_47970, partial [Actinoplanes sp. Pm04-4]
RLYKRNEAGAEARHELDIAAQRSAFRRSEFALDMETIGHDPRRALMAAFADGRMDARALSERLRELDDLDRRAAIEEAQRERDERLQLETRSREDAEAQRRREHEERMKTLDQEREDSLRREKEDREDRLHDQEARRKDAEEERKRQYDFLKTAASQGLFNTMDTHGQGERLFAKV